MLVNEIMQTSSAADEVKRRKPPDVGLLRGRQDRHYAFGLATVLTAAGVTVDVIGSDEIDSPELDHQAESAVSQLSPRAQRQNELVQKLQSCFLHYATAAIRRTPQSEGLRKRNS